MGVWRQMFGPSRKEIWGQLSGEIGGEYISRWCGDKVEARHGEWTVTLDTVTHSTGKTHVVYTRLRAPYVNPEGFRFTIYRRSIFSGLATWLGMQDIEVGNPEFDREFVVKATHEERVRLLLANEDIVRLIVAQPAIHLSVKDDEGWFGATFPEGVDELHFYVLGIIKDVERLKQLYELFSLVLEALVDMGSAYPRDPGVSL